MNGSKDAKPTSRRAFLMRIAGRTPRAPVRPDSLYGTPTPDQFTITPTHEFFVAQIDDVPHIDPKRWMLRIDGLVDTPLTLDRETLHRLPRITTVQTIACIDSAHGKAIGNARWRGYRLKPLLARAGVQATARRACFYAADGYSTAIDLWWLMREGVMLADTMNGAPLATEHGAPLRLLVPGLYGQKMPKWITRIALIDHAYTGSWERHGWSDVAAVQTRALFRSPPPYARIDGTVYLQGVAYAGDRAIERVTLSVDGGPWMDTTLVPPAAPHAWTAWYLRWEPNVPGVHTFRVRATDARGLTQPEAAQGRAFPSGVNAIDQRILIVA